MKDMKVAKKLMLSFIIIAALAAAVGIVGITGMKRMDAASTDMYKSQTEPLAYMSTVTETLQRMRVNMREYAIGAVTGDTNQIENAHAAIEGNKKVMKENIALYRSTLVNPEAIQLFDEAGNLYDTNYQKSLQLAYDLAKAGDVDGVVAAIEAVKADVEKIDNNLDKCLEIRIASAATTSDNISSLARTLLALIIIVLLVAVAASLFLAVYVSGLISKPLAYLNQGFHRIGTMGEVKFSDEEYKLAVEYAGSKDEVGDTMRMTLLIIQRLADVGKNLEAVADGDLTGELALLSDKDTMGLSLKKMVDNLNRMFSEIHNASEQVATGSEEIAQGSQNLAQGSTDQASVVEQLFASISEVADKTTHNADMAKEAAELSGVIRDNAEKGSLQMDQLMQAVREINEASGSISKVIKVIDDIAFQTNILALNAAIEAARAGQHGRGFAVVAEEVRSLAAKSAEAAKDTSDMIENSIDKANFGLDIATDTTASLKDIVAGINRSTENISQIARSSEEQARAITQINMGIDQVAQVVQQNSATAEESAAAAEEMSSQSLLLQELIGKFRIRNY